MAELEVGQTIATGLARLTQDAAIGYAQEFDPKPMHFDDGAAASGFFGTLTASGWHAIALSMRLAVDARPFGDHPLIGTELSRSRFSCPILPETDLVVRITFEAIEQGKGRHEYSILFVETLDAAAGDVLIRQNWRMLRQ